MVDPSLLRLAAERGVTICFADLDGADGLWVPEERTVLVNRVLSEREVAAVIEHELGHVAIDDQHADLDAGVVRRPPGARPGWAAALTAAACVALIGGVTVGMASRQQATVNPKPVVAPSAPPLTGPAEPSVVTVVKVVGPNGEVTYRTETRTARPPAAAAPSVPASATGARTPGPATGKPTSTAAPPGSPTNPPVTTAPATTPPPTPTPEPTASPTESVPAGTDEVGTGDAGVTGTGTGTAGASAGTDAGTAGAGTG